MLELRYKNDLGEVVMCGTDTGSIRICELKGLGALINEYNTAVYPECDGQETISQRAMPRDITVLLEVCSKSVTTHIRNALTVFSKTGMLYIKTENLDRRIKCNQVQIPDVDQIVKGQLLSFAVQFVCDSPYFEDGQDTVVPLYQVDKLLSTPFVLPTAFGSVAMGADIQIKGIVPTEPVITISFADTALGAENIFITNETTGKSIKLEYTSQADEQIVIDIKTRKITSSIAGNIINYISDDTFLGDFVLKKGINKIALDMGDVGPAITIECRYNNLYNEAVIV